MRLLAHQVRLRQQLSQVRFPFYIYWGMGSGKTIGGLLCIFSLLSEGETALVICDKSICEQWKKELQKVRASKIGEDAASNVEIVITHYETLDCEDAIDPVGVSVVVIDEAHRFRNAWHTMSHRMLGWIAWLERCNRLIYMSGTPIVHDADIEMAAFRRLMQSKSNEDMVGRVSYYDPRTDSRSRHHYAQTRHVCIEVPMSWAQTFLYLEHRRQSFRLALSEDDVRERISTNKNAYGTKLRSISNCPFSDEPALSPKMERVISELLAHERDNMRQIVYSTRRDTGIDALQCLWKQQTQHPKRIFRIDGGMSVAERAAQMDTFNRSVRASVLFITDAGAQGVDCKRVDVVHILEPAESVQDERQTINRAVRYKSHASRPGAYAVVIKQYVSVFPRTAAVAPPWKAVIYKSGMFDRAEMTGITRRVQYALKDLIRNEEGYETIDQRTMRIREARDADVQLALQTIQSFSI